jgi:hypothetical protein
MTLATHVTRTEAKLPRMTSEDSDTAFTVDGHYIALETLRQWVKAEVMELRALVYEKLFFGKIPAASKDGRTAQGATNKLQDDFANISPGYSFLSDDRNNPREQQFLLLKLVLTDPKLYERFCVEINGAMRWKRGAIMEYLVDCQEAWCRLAGCMQFSGGLAQSGGELAGTAIRNTVHQLRSVYVFDEDFSTIGFCSRTHQNQLLDDVLLRFYTEEVSDTAIAMTTILRPFETILANEGFDDDEKVQCYQQYLFVGMGKPMTVRQLSDGFANRSEPVLGLRVYFNLWSQISNFLRQKYCPVLRWLESSISQDAGLQQGGHSARIVALYYGREKDRIRNLTDPLVEVCRYLSKEWQYFLRIGPPISSKLPPALDRILGDNAIRALSSLSPGQDEMKEEIKSLRIRMASAKIELQAAANSQIDLIRRLGTVMLVRHSEI